MLSPGLGSLANDERSERTAKARRSGRLLRSAKEGLYHCRDPHLSGNASKSTHVPSSVSKSSALIIALLPAHNTPTRRSRKALRGRTTWPSRPTNVSFTPGMSPCAPIIRHPTHCGVTSRTSTENIPSLLSNMFMKHLPGISILFSFVQSTSMRHPQILIEATQESVSLQANLGCLVEAGKVYKI